MTEPHDAPDTGELLDAVRGFLEAEVVPVLEGRRRFHALVAVNVLGMVQRELDLGPAQSVAHAERLGRLGVRDEGELAQAIRSGSLAGREAEVREAVRATVADKLRVTNPSYLEEGDPDRA